MIFIALVALILLVISATTGSVSLGFFAIVVIFLLGAWAHLDAEHEKYLEQLEHERWYQSTSVDERIDYHLNRAKVLGTNYDANIAQALINRKST